MLNVGADTTCSSDICDVHPKTSLGMGGVPRDGRDKKDTVSVHIAVFDMSADSESRIRILTEIEPDWCVQYFVSLVRKISYILLRLLEHGHVLIDKRSAQS